MKHKAQLDKLENQFKARVDLYIKNAPMHILEAIVERDYLPSWDEIVNREYEAQETIRHLSG